MSRLRTRLAAACAVYALALTAQAQQPPATQPPLFGEEIDVRVVNLEVVVTDREGRRVPGLKAGDFRLRVDGKEVPIEYFSEIKDGRTVSASAEGATPNGDEAGVQSLAEGAVGTFYLVFIDDYFSIAPRRNEVLKALKGDLSRLRPDDRMAIVAYDGGKLALLSNWSGSPADLGRAFDQAMARTPRGFNRGTERRSFLNDEAFAAQFLDDGTPLDLSVRSAGLTAGQRAYADTLARQIKDVARAAVGAMRGFAAPRGRKVMLLLSGGWPFSIHSYITGGAKMPTREIPEGDQLLGPLASTANLLGYTLYPVDVPGIQTAGESAEDQTPGDVHFGNIAEQEVEGSLSFLAQETGGKPLLNSNRMVTLEYVGADVSSFYWLGFSPSWQHNDKSHEVKVEARRPGLEVRSRTNFLDLSHRAEVSMKVESALLFGNYPGVLPMPMRLGPPVRSQRGEVEIPVSLGLPADVMTVVPVNGRYTARLELRFAAADSHGNSSEIPVLPLNLSSERPPTPGKFVRYETRIKLKGAANHLAVGLYDPLSGKMAAAEADIGKIPPASPHP